MSLLRLFLLAPTSLLAIDARTKITDFECNAINADRKQEVIRVHPAQFHFVSSKKMPGAVRSRADDQGNGVAGLRKSLACSLGPDMKAHLYEPASLQNMHGGTQR